MFILHLFPQNNNYLEYIIEMTKKVITRFAPSPTGFLHIGGARTALFNWLFAKHHNGEFLLRIEDTDRKRLTEGAVDAIFEGLNWLGIDHDGEAVSQYERRDRHAEVAKELLAQGNAYYCYCSTEELAEMRERAKAEGRSIGYDGTWRDRDPSEAPKDVRPVVRFKSPNIGQTTIKDQVQGDVVVDNTELDDMILLRADGSPTYMLSVVVDDHDMGVTYVIRGDDHLTNAARQTQLIEAIGWALPVYAHIPLIHGPDGAKLSKRHGALGVEAYRDMGYLPSAIKNYLLRLGWSHGDDEIISEEEAILWFDLNGIGKSPSRFDFAKLENMNGLYIREKESNKTLVDICRPIIEKSLNRNLTEHEVSLLINAMDEFKPRAKNINELAASTLFLFTSRPLMMNDKAEKILSSDAKAILAELIPLLETSKSWDISTLEADIKAFSEEKAIKLGNIAQPIRASLTGSNVSPGIFDILVWLGKEESLNRLKDQTN